MKFEFINVEIPKKDYITVRERYEGEGYHIYNAHYNGDYTMIYITFSKKMEG